MPKRGKRIPGDSADSRDIHEGRPAGLTLGAFLVSSQGTCSVQTQQEYDVNEVQKKTDDKNIPIKQSFYITRTKKGKLPITYENRSKGKKVTVVSNVSGDVEGLVTKLRKRFGVGGVARGTMIELQGDQQKYVEEFFKNHPCYVK